VALTLKTLKGVPVVPSQTVQLSKQGPFLFTVKPDQTVEKRLVKTGPQYGNYLVIEEGVSANETVVVEGQIALANGIKIQPKDYQNDAPAQSPDLTQRDPTPNDPAIKPPVSPAKRPAS
jgi:membrane fusion protein (multidrug efflux system)